jgi:hypothetical protein
MKNIRNIDRYIGKELKTFRVVSPRIDEEHRNKLGVENLVDGESLVPRALGRVTRLNCDGEYIVFKDLQKEIRFIREIEWHWRDWGGHEHSKIVPIYRDCYPRKFIDPLEKEIIFKNGRFFSEILTRSNEKEVKHVINMFLEIFGDFEVVQEDFSTIAEIKRVNFEILRPGEYPFEMLMEHLNKNKRRGSMSQNVLEDRLAFYRKNFNIQYVMIGVHGYAGYFGFEVGNSIIFDNNRYANAIYIFELLAKDCCRLTKKDVIRGGLYKARITHGSDWKFEVLKYFNKIKAA